MNKLINILRVKAHSIFAQEQLREFIGCSKTVDDSINLNMTLSQRTSECLEETKTWKHANWGVISFNNIVVRQQQNDFICITFLTEAGEPLKWLNIVSERFSMLDFDLEYSSDKSLNPYLACNAYNGNLVKYSHQVEWTK